MRALAQITAPPFRAIVWKSLGLTLALLALVWLALTRFLIGGCRRGLLSPIIR